MLYVDYSECKMAEGTSKSGGYNYIYHVLELLDSKGIDTTVIVPVGFLPDRDEKSILGKNRISTLETDNISTVKLSPDSTLFIPLLAVAKMPIIDQIKTNNPSCKVYITIHGVRRLDLKYDKYDKFYYKGLKKAIYPLIGRLSFCFGNIVYKSILRNYMPKYDKVFTVSNATLQQLVKIGTPQYIKWFYQGADIAGIAPKSDKAVSDERYILFVSGNRSEKNLLRFLVAFIQYKKQNNDDIHLYVTGLNENTKGSLLKCKELDKIIIDKWVSFLGYVDDEVLNQLYYRAQYVAYPSKSEGFGLPVEEAIMRGVPVVASYITSIPEVVDSTIVYMDPYSINSMVNAIKKMDTQETKRQLLAIEEKKKIVIERITQCNNDLISELIEFEVRCGK